MQKKVAEFLLQITLSFAGRHGRLLVMLMIHTGHTGEPSAPADDRMDVDLRGDDDDFFMEETRLY